MENLYQTAKAWLKEPEYENILILDPDGWDRSNFERSWNELIDRDEFNIRLNKSTVKIR